MRKILEWAIQHPTVVNLIMIGVAVASLITIDRLPKESFPETALDEIHIQVEFRGAGPNEIETGILIKIEEAVQGISGIDMISSEAQENVGFVRLELARGSNADDILREVKDEIEKITTFPKDSEKPAIFKLTRKTAVLQFVLAGKAPRAQLQTLAEQLKDEFLKQPRIKLVDVQGVKNREISIELDEESLRRYHLKLSDVTLALQTANLDMSGGTLRTRREDFRLRVYAKKYLAKELEQLIIRNVPGSTPIRLKDIGKAREAFEDVPLSLYFNGKPGVLLNIQSAKQDDILKVAEQAKALYATLQKQLPPGITMALYRDATVQLRSRMALLISNGFQGLILVLIVLAFFMNVRLAFWVAAGLVFGLLGAFISAWATGLSINMISLFGLLLVIGILVDDAIVVSENVYVHIEMGKHPIQAAIDGTIEVMPAVLSAVITTCLTFLPLFFMGGFIGKFIYMIPAMVIAALLWSLFESLFLLPPHLAHSLKPRTSLAYQENRVRRMFDAILRWLREGIYAPSLRVVLNYRWATLAGSIGLMLLAVGLLGGGFVKFVFFPALEGDQIVARFTMKPGTPLSETRRIAEMAEQKAKELGEELKKTYGKPILVHTLRWLGQQTVRGAGQTPPTGEEVGEVQLELIPGEERKVTSFQVINMWRAKMGNPVGVTRLSFEQLMGPPVGNPLEFELRSKDPQQLQRAADFLKQQLATFPGVFNPEDDLNLGKRELRMKRTPLAESLGISMQTIASEVRSRIYGQDVMRLQRGRDDVRVMVRYPDKNRDSIRKLEEIWITAQNGNRLPFSQLVTWDVTRELKVIRRMERQRKATVFAQLDENKGNRQDIVLAMQRRDFPQLKQLTPDVAIVLAGQGREQAKVVGGMRIALPLSMFGVFFCLALIFSSYGKILIVMAMIPFGVIGAVLGHWLMGIPLTILSFFGIVGVAGVVVNDSIVLMDAINRYSQGGTPVFHAVWIAGQSRLRAILSTTLTTAAGLFPLLMEKSFQAQFLIPMALSLAAGVTFATFLTLFLVPSLYLIRLDVKRTLYWLRKGQWLDADTFEQMDQKKHVFEVPHPANHSSSNLDSPQIM